MSWNYRLVRDSDGLYMSEVYYHDDGTPRSYRWDATPSYDPETDTEGPVEAIEWVLNKMLEACKKPILYYPGDFRID